VVARFGELDVARWWNSNGQLGRLGAVVLRRGFSRTYRFAQARSVFAIAAQKCDELFNPPGCVTLWKLPGAIEEEFDAHWERWLDQARTGIYSSTGLKPSAARTVELLRDFELVSEADLDAYARLRRSAEGYLRRMELRSLQAGEP